MELLQPPMISHQAVLEAHQSAHSNNQVMVEAKQIGHGQKHNPMAKLTQTLEMVLRRSRL